MRTPKRIDYTTPDGIEAAAFVARGTDTDELLGRLLAALHEQIERKPCETRPATGRECM